MSDKPRILFQLDPGPHASSFDSVVAIDAGVDRLLPFDNVEPAAVQDIVHGAMFTRGGDDLKHTAVFVGGSDVEQGETLFRQVNKTFFGPVRVSTMLDTNGANTTAVAAVLSAAKHLNLAETEAAVLAGTGPVGQRVVRLLCRAGANVRLCSRRAERAAAVCERIAGEIGGDGTKPIATQTANLEETVAAVADTHLVICAGAAGIQLLDQHTWSSSTSLRVVIDLNAVPPAGAEAVEVMDKGTERHGKVVYGAVGVGGLKMKIHKASIARLFTANDLVLDAEEIMAIGEELQA